MVQLQEKFNSSNNVAANENEIWDFLWKSAPESCILERDK